jgi:HAD superfamily hydrolase (TIGR01509 family)
MNLPRKPHAVVFDMDGLIFDTESLYRDAMIGAAIECGHVMQLPLYLSTIGLSGESTRALLDAHYGQAFDFDAFWEIASKQFRAMVEVRLCLKTGVVELLDALDEAGLSRAIATSSRHHDVRRHLAAHGLRERFQAVVAEGDYAHGKPNPDPFLKAAERLGVAPELCLALEDSYNGVRAAASAGMMTIMVPDLLDPTEEMHRLCVLIARDLHEVHDLIRAVS